MKRRLHPIAMTLTLGLALLLGLSACSKSPQQWLAYGKQKAVAGDHQKAVAAFDKALTKPGAWAADAQLARARSLYALKRWPEAARSAEQSANGLTEPASHPGLLLALQACAEGGDRITGKAVLGRLGTDAALKDPAVMAAAVKLGLAAAPAAAPMSTAPAAAGKAKPGVNLPAPKVKVNVGLLDAVRLGIGQVLQATSVGPEFNAAARFQDPRTVVQVPSPDGKWRICRNMDKSGYWLFLSDSNGKNVRKVKSAKNGFQPVWSPDSKHVLFNAMDWQTEERNLFILDVPSLKVRRAFKAAQHKVGPLAAWSPDGKKIVYTYADNLWVMNVNANGRALLDLQDAIGKPVDDAALLGFSVDGQRIIYQSRRDPALRVIELAPRI